VPLLLFLYCTTREVGQWGLHHTSKDAKKWRRRSVNKMDQLLKNLGEQKQNIIHLVM
jgi:hypothetical protein